MRIVASLAMKGAFFVLPLAHACHCKPLPPHEPCNPARFDHQLHIAAHVPQGGGLLGPLHRAQGGQGEPCSVTSKGCPAWARAVHGTHLRNVMPSAVHVGCSCSHGCHRIPCAPAVGPPPDATTLRLVAAHAGGGGGAAGAADASLQSILSTLPALLS